MDYQKIAAELLGQAGGAGNIAVWLMCAIEKKLHRVVPSMFDLFVTRLVFVFVTGYLTLAAIGPVSTFVETNIINVI